MVEQFADDAERVRAFHEWKTRRDAWSATEIIARAAMEIYERLYDLHARIMREAERLELVLGDGILNWKRDDGGIHHPLLLQRLHLDFDSSKQEFVLREADAPTEFYSALFRGLTDVPGQSIGAFRQEVEEGHFDPLGGEDTDEFLRQMVARLSAQGEFTGTLALDGEKPYPRVGRSPVIFLRNRILGFSTALENVLADIPMRGEMPASLLGVVGSDNSTDTMAPDSATSSAFSYGNEDEGVLFSKPANPEQLAIAQRLERHGNVLVQGPPGTGKTHTIANLVGHLLAQGKTVLVTSQTTKALRVLREKVVPTLQPLCVSVLENDSQSRQQLESAVNAIVERLSSSDGDNLEREAHMLDDKRRALLQKLRQTRQQLCEARSNEYRDIVWAGTSCSPSQAAREIVEGQDQHGWIPTPVTLGVACPLSTEELSSLYASNARVTEDDERDLNSALPTVEQLLAPAAFERLVTAENELKQHDLSRDTALWKAASVEQTSKSLGELQEKLVIAIQPILENEPWRLAALAAGHAGSIERASWESLLHIVESARVQAAVCKEAIFAHGPVLSNEFSADEQDRVLDDIVAHLKSGGNLGALTLLTKRAWKKLLETSRVGSSKPTQMAHFEALQSLSKLQIARQELVARWERQMVPLGAPGGNALGDEPEISCAQFAGTIRDCLSWRDAAWTPLEREIIANGLNWNTVLERETPVLSSHAELLRLRNAIQNQVPALLQTQARRLQWHHVQKTLQMLNQRIAVDDSSTRSALDVAPTIASRLSAAVTNRDLATYRQLHNRLSELVERRAFWQQRNVLLEKLRAFAPAWATAIAQRQVPHDKTVPPGNSEQAWRWRQLRDELQRRDEISAEALQKQIEELIYGVQNATADLIDRRAWAAQARRTSNAQRKALIGWVQTVRKIGKGTGKRVPKLQQDARRLMNECRSAVPVWIMPLARVVENFDPRSTRFDVVIVDEASQSDVMGLIAFYLGKRVVVVGDDEQVSPDAVGQRVDEVQHLIDEHLSGIPNANLYDGQYSVYDVAMTSFGGTICLREHFRCVPDIIRFSNHLSYNGAIKPLRDASMVHLKPHVIAHRVAGAASDNKINEQEALAVASLLIAATEQNEYSNASFGVVSLNGVLQAERIDFLLRSHLEPSEYERRQIVCGNAAHFQGDERDVMFLSVVDAPKDGPLFMNERPAYRKRLNVAASRARDQMWVVHSLQPETDLKKGDLRRRFLEYAQDPEALERLFESEEAHVESEFERQVLRRLLGAGYRVIPQWKVGGYRIDLVVEGSGKRLAVECDGDRYHALDKLPDDMARQAVLERLGWTFARIRGSAFFRNPDKAMLPVFEKLKVLNIAPEGYAENANFAPQNNVLIDHITRRAAELRLEWDESQSLDMNVEL